MGRFYDNGYLEMNGADAAKLSIDDGDRLKVISTRGELVCNARINSDLPREILFVPISLADGSVYELFGMELDPRSKTPAIKSCAVRLERA
jgi:predicted molibdopterin-dependent oxidoreductase YjgC